MDGWIMLGIVIFVMVAQGLLWSWVFIQKQRVAPDVKIMNLRELYDGLRKTIDDFTRRGTERR